MYWPCPIEDKFKYYQSNFLSFFLSKQKGICIHFSRAKIVYFSKILAAPLHVDDQPSNSWLFISNSNVVYPHSDYHQQYLSPERDYLLNFTIISSIIATNNTFPAALCMKSIFLFLNSKANTLFSKITLLYCYSFYSILISCRILMVIVG